MRFRGRTLLSGLRLPIWQNGGDALSVRLSESDTNKTVALLASTFVLKVPKNEQSEDEDDEGKFNHAAAFFTAAAFLAGAFFAGTFSGSAAGASALTAKAGISMRAAKANSSA